MLRMISTLLMSGILSATAGAEEGPVTIRSHTEAFIQSQTIQGQLTLGRTLHDEYAKYFFKGLTHPYGGAFTQSTLAHHAYSDGQAYWREHPSERAGRLAEYGYVAVEREGVWSSGFEKSAFEPSDAGGERWWMTTFGDGAWSEVDLDPRRGGRVRIVGYLSPTGQYGHLGAYEREILVTSGAYIDFDNH